MGRNDLYRVPDEVLPEIVSDEWEISAEARSCAAELIDARALILALRENNTNGSKETRENVRKLSAAYFERWVWVDNG